MYSNGGKTITISMKGWKWSNGETVNANDVIFWLHMMYAEYANWGGAGPTSFSIPWSITSMAATGTNQLTLHLNKAYSSLWYTYNQLSQITPMPMAWDVTSLTAKAGSGGCTTDSAADKWAKCKAVYNFLAAQAKATATLQLQPDLDGGGRPVEAAELHHRRQRLVRAEPEVLRQPEAADLGVQAGGVHRRLDRVHRAQDRLAQHRLHPAADLAVKNASQVLPGSNPLGSGYKLSPNYDWGFAYYQINFKNPPVWTSVFKQLYARQALEYVADQNGIVQGRLPRLRLPEYRDRAGEPTTNQWLPSAQKANGGQGPYPFSISQGDQSCLPATAGRRSAG